MAITSVLFDVSGILGVEHIFVFLSLNSLAKKKPVHTAVAGAGVRLRRGRSAELQPRPISLS
nr:MAG TPA: hypothetical protein [Caudoviricetes sp.]